METEDVGWNERSSFLQYIALKKDGLMVKEKTDAGTQMVTVDYWSA